jgi:hypothetical protein
MYQINRATIRITHKIRVTVENDVLAFPACSDNFAIPALTLSPMPEKNDFTSGANSALSLRPDILYHVVVN